MYRFEEESDDEDRLSDVAVSTEEVNEEECASQAECTGSSQEVTSDDDESEDNAVHSNVGSCNFLILCSIASSAH